MYVHKYSDRSRSQDIGHNYYIIYSGNFIGILLYDFDVSQGVLSNYIQIPCGYLVLHYVYSLI